MTKRLFAALLSVLMMLSVLPVTFAADVATTTYVAEVNDNKYATLSEAVAAAEAGATIKLLANIEITEAATFSMKSGVTLDLNGMTVTAKDAMAIFNGENFTIKNGTFQAKASKDYYLLTIDSASTKALRTASNITLEGLTVMGGGVKIRGGATVTMKNNNIQANQSQFKYAVWAYGSANVTIESGTYFGGKNGYDVFAEGGAKIDILGGTYKYTIVDRYIDDSANVGVIKGEDSSIKVDHVAEVNGVKYGSLQDAINAATPGSNVTLLGSIGSTKQILINKSLNLNLGTYTITGNTSDAVLRIYSNVVDTEIKVTISSYYGGIVNNGPGYAIYAGEDISGGNDKERTNLIIYGGVYQTAGTDCIKQIMGLCTIEGGTYKSSFGRTVLNGERWYGSEFKINAGEFYEFNPACVSVWTGFDGKDYSNFYHQHDIIEQGRTVEYKDGWYKVVDDDTYTAKVELKSLCYPSLEAAIRSSINMNDIANLGVITLLADDTLDLGGATITLPKGLVIDLGGHTLTIPYQKTLFAGENITIKNGTITTGTANQYGLYLMSGSFTVENVVCKNGINVQEANVTLNNVAATNPNNKYYAVYAGPNANVTILNGTFKNTSKTHAIVYGNVTIYGGTFSKLPPVANLAADRHVVKNVSGYNVYQGFLNALAMAQAGDTVYLMSSIEVADTITIDKAITLDLGANTITSTAAKNVIYSTADLTINATTGGIYSETAYVAVGQDNGVCTINGGSFKASGNTGDHANGQPVYNSLVLNNSDFSSGVTGSFVINGGKFYGFNPGCMSVNKHDHHNHTQIATGKIATLDAAGWFTVTEGKFAYKVVCDCSAPASAHQHCFASEAEAKQFIEMMGNCKFDKVVEIGNNN